MKGIGKAGLSWLLVVMLSALIGCYSDESSSDDEDQAQVTIRIGDSGTGMSTLNTEPGELGLMAGVPPTVQFIELKVSGPGMEDFSERYEVGVGDSVEIDLSFPPGTDRLFEVTASGIATVYNAGGETEDLELVAFIGETQTELQPGPNTVIVTMNPLAYIRGVVRYIKTDIPYYIDTPLANHVETEGEVPIQTDGQGLYMIQLPLGEYSVEVNPEVCPTSTFPDFFNCFAFGVVDLTFGGQVAELDLFIIPPEGINEFLSWASSIYPKRAEVGDLVTIYGIHIKGVVEDKPTLAFGWTPAGGGFFASNVIGWDDNSVTVEVPAEAVTGDVIGYIPFQERRETNPINFVLVN